MTDGVAYSRYLCRCTFADGRCGIVPCGNIADIADNGDANYYLWKPTNTLNRLRWQETRASLSNNQGR